SIWGFRQSSWDQWLRIPDFLEAVYGSLERAESSSICPQGRGRAVEARPSLAPGPVLPDVALQLFVDAEANFFRGFDFVVSLVEAAGHEIEHGEVAVRLAGCGVRGNGRLVLAFGVLELAAAEVRGAQRHRHEVGDLDVFEHVVEIAIADLLESLNPHLEIPHVE